MVDDYKIVNGQHRTVAFAKYLRWLANNHGSDSRSTTPYLPCRALSTSFLDSNPDIRKHIKMNRESSGTMADNITAIMKNEVENWRKTHPSEDLKEM
jgi:hypothetical protein